MRIECVNCGDKPDNTHGTTSNDSDEDDDNFEVTETDVKTEGSDKQNIDTEAYERVVRELEDLVIGDSDHTGVEQHEPTPPKPSHSYRSNRPTRRPRKEFPQDKPYEQGKEFPKDKPYEQGKHVKPEAIYDKAVMTVSKPKRIRKCESIKFFKIDQTGNMVEMGFYDYTVYFKDKSALKYSFDANLEMIKCDGDTVYKHKSGLDYALTLTYNKCAGRFVIRLKNHFLFIRYAGRTWVEHDRIIPDYIKIFTQDSEGNYVELTPQQCKIDITATGSFKYYVKGLNCTRIEIYGEVIYQKKDHEDYPESVSYSLKKCFMIYFNGFVRSIERRHGKFREVYTRSSPKWNVH